MNIFRKIFDYYKFYFETGYTLAVYSDTILTVDLEKLPSKNNIDKEFIDKNVSQWINDNNICCKISIDFSFFDRDYFEKLPYTRRNIIRKFRIKFLHESERLLFKLALL